MLSMRRAAPAKFMGSMIVALLFAAFAWTAAAGPWPPWMKEEERPEPVYPDVTATASWLADNLGSRGLVVVDARPHASYLAGHVPGAISVPARQLPGLPDVRRAFGKYGLAGRGRIVCYGDSSYSADAALVFWALEAAGAEGAMILEGGLSGWVATGRDVSTRERVLPPVAWGPPAKPERVATAAYLSLKFGEKGYEVIDARGWDAWEGPVDESRWGSSVRAGHIPHALPFDFRQFVLPDGAFVSPEETRQILGRLGPRPSTPVDLWDEFIVHDDGSSGEGALGYFFMRRAGVERVRYFRGGWDRWAADPNLPLVRIVHADELKFRLAKERRWFRPDAPPRSFVFFDVRHHGDYDRGHVPGAVNLSSTYFVDSLDVYVERYWPDVDRASTPIVTYCYGSNCIRSRNCSTWAARAGFIEVERFYGGLEEWRVAGGKIIR